MWPSLGRLWPSSRSVRHSRSVGERGFALESAAARVCREAGRRVRTNVLVRELDFHPGQNRLNARRAQLAVDTTFWSQHSAQTGPFLGREQQWVEPRRARARKERTYPELAGEEGRARLVVLAAEVGGCWSNEASQFVRSLALAHAWNRRWRKLLACTAAKSFANTLLEQTLRAAPSEADVMRDCAHEWRAWFVGVLLTD